MAVALAVVAGRAQGRTPDPLPDRGSGSAISATFVRAQPYVVRTGDTLWEVARAVVGAEGDPRPMIEVLREANGLGTAPLVAGTRLLVPTAPG